MQKFPNLKNIYHLIATLGGIGLIPIAPGTFGSIFAWAIFIFMAHLLGKSSILILTIISIFFAIWRPLGVVLGTIVCKVMGAYFNRRCNFK